MAGGCDKASTTRPTSEYWRVVRSIAQQVDGATYWKGERADSSAAAALQGSRVRVKGREAEARRRGCNSRKSVQSDSLELKLQYFDHITTNAACHRWAGFVYGEQLWLIAENNGKCTQ